VIGHGGWLFWPAFVLAMLVGMGLFELRERRGIKR
jgi:hypothetical protein